MKFGTQIEDSLNINHSDFGASNFIPLIPPLSKCAHTFMLIIIELLFNSS